MELSGVLDLEKLIYINMPCKEATRNYLLQCAEIFSRCYGVWTKTGKRVSLTPTRLQNDYLFNDSCRLIVAKYEDKILGHAFYTSFNLETLGGKIVWITQLVVDDKYRNMNIAQTLILSCMGTEAKAVGLCTSHPYAVKALEKATKCKVDPDMVIKHAKELIAKSNILYLEGATLKCTNDACLIDTKFDVDHTEINAILKELTNRDEWKLGKLPDEHEFFAVVFIQ
jgi:hypothetical protein